MKRISTYFLFLFTLVFASCMTTQQIDSQSYSSDGDITYQQFYDDLSPYGNWVNYQNYGYVWVPEEVGFRPYYNNGHWVYTNYGWTWASDYNWGWAPFHYGRWLYDDDYGWMWIPGYEWAPAWVSWRNSPDYYGWAPLGPGANFNASIGSQIPYNYWAFVPHRYINSPRINNYYIDRQKNVTIINNTTIINNIRITDRKTQYVAGPTPTDVEKNTNEKIRQVRLVNRTRPGNTQVTGNSLSIYKPPVKQTPQTNTVRPPKVSDLNLIRAHRVNSENGKAEDSQPQTLPVTEQKLSSTVEEKPKPQPPVNQQNLPPTRIQESNEQNPPQQNNEQVTRQKNLQEKVIQQRQENNLQKNNEPVNKQNENVAKEPVIKNNPPVTRDNPPVNAQENKPPLKIKRNVPPVQRKLNNPSLTPVTGQPQKVQQNRSIQQQKQNYQTPRERPAKEVPVIKNQIPIPRPPIKRQDDQKDKKD
jgi:hypothetical protein